MRVCVVGAGIGGIVAVKACLDEGLEVVCYDRRSEYGGLWRYCNNGTEDDFSVDDFTPSVMKTTILNTSKELSAFSDYPPPATLPNYMKHNLYMDYIDGYVRTFNLEAYLNLGHQVHQCTPQVKQTETSKTEVCWQVVVENIRTSEKRVETFDKLMIAVGHHNIPYMPVIPGQDKYEGKIFHSAMLKDILNDKRFTDKRVVVVGLGNSACDAATDLSLVVDQCYVSCHRGDWFICRYSPKGPCDIQLKRRWLLYRSKLIPKSMTEKILVNLLESRTNHKVLGLTPKHKITENRPVINDLFQYRIYTGGIIVKSSILRLTKNGVIFQGEDDQEYPIDAIVLATGYHAKVPFLDERKLGMKCGDLDEYELYLNMWATKISIPGLEVGAVEAVKSLAYIGLVQPTGSLTVISELQSRLAVSVFKGKVQLPEPKAMLSSIEADKRRRPKSVKSHSRDVIVDDWIKYSDKIAEHLGVKPSLKKLFFKDLPLWKKLMFGPSVSYQYRLSGPGAWDKARETIMDVDKRVAMGVNDGKNEVLFKRRIRSLNESVKL